MAGVILVLSASKSAPAQLGSIFVYVAALVTVLVVSLGFNMAPIAPIKRLLARLDQAAIFLLIAGTYAPMLALLNGTPVGTLMLVGVWSGALTGIALKLIVPQHFGRLALFLYAGIGWSGVLVFQSLAAALPGCNLRSWPLSLGKPDLNPGVGLGCTDFVFCGYASSSIRPLRASHRSRKPQGGTSIAVDQNNARAYRQAELEYL